MSRIHVGDQAPDFTLTDHTGELFNLSTALSRSAVILVFYTLDGSPTCTTMLCRINDEVADFAREGFQIVGINYANQARHEALVRKNVLKMPLLSDNDYRVSRAYDSLFEVGPIRAIRYSVVGITQDGRVAYFQRGRPSNAEIFTGMGITLPRVATV